MLHCGDVRPDRAKVEVDERRIAQQMREEAEQAGERPATPKREAPERGDR